MPSPLNIFIVASDNINKRYDNVCSALKENGHHVNVWNDIPILSYTPLIDNFIKTMDKLARLENMGEKYTPVLLEHRDFCRATIGLSWADMLLLVGRGWDAAFLTGIAYAAGVRTVVFEEYPFGLDKKLIAEAVSYWCRTIKDVVDLANNWEDPLPKRLEE